MGHKKFFFFFFPFSFEIGCSGMKSSLWSRPGLAHYVTLRGRSGKLRDRARPPKIKVRGGSGGGLTPAASRSGFLLL